MSDRKDKIREAIQVDHEASLAIFNRVSPEQWSQPVPSDEGAEWKARDVLAHLATAEGGQLGQIARLLAGGETVAADFDLNRFNRRSVQKLAERSVPELLAVIERDHAQVLAAFETVREADLDKTGRHSRGDTISVERFFGRITRHRQAHAQELAAALGL